MKDSLSHIDPAGLAERHRANDPKNRANALRLMHARRGDLDVASLAGFAGVSRDTVNHLEPEDEDAIPGGPDDDEEP